MLSIVAGKKKKAKAKTTIEKEMKEAFMRVVGKDLLVRRQTKEKQRRIRIANGTEKHMRDWKKYLSVKGDPCLDQGYRKTRNKRESREKKKLWQ